jgi:16S rRNA (cytosine967-C5)-methyltransferase
MFDTDPQRAAEAVAWLAADTRDTRAYRAAVAGEWPPGGTLSERAQHLNAAPEDLLPSWFRAECPEIFTPAELAAQLARAPLWLRLQTENPDAVAAEFAAKGWRAAPSPALNTAWRVFDEADVTQSEAFSRGSIEIQDLGSQLVLASLDVRAAERWLDACAGAGGKTLQLSRLLRDGGSVVAHDIRPEALDELLHRADRAGSTNISTATDPLRQKFDGVLVDAPCSGSGTWRRSPHLKWTTTAVSVTAHAQLQLTLLKKFSAGVRRGGLLVYATCSLAQTENAGVVKAFVRQHPEFTPEPPARTFGFTASPEGLTILPARHNTDGFFVAPLRRR